MKKCLYITLLTSISTSLIFWANTDFIVEKCLHNKVSPSVVHLVCLALPLIAMSSAISGYFAGVRRMYKNAIGQFIDVDTIIIELQSFDYQGIDKVYIQTTLPFQAH